MNKKINRKILLTTVLLIILTSNLITISNATVINENTSIFSNRTSKILINYKGKEMVTVFNTYRNNGILYEAYNVKYPTYSYNNASQKELISENEFVWQVLANGFPYKTIEELKCANYEEAYAATQIAIYCAYCGHSESDYSAIANNASSQNVYNAFKEILQNARKNTIQTDKNTVVKLIENDNEWKIDNENNMLYRTYKIKPNFDIQDYNVEILNANFAKITDEQNVSKNKFNKEESFKISIPMSELKNCGELEIKITTDIKTMPIYLATSNENKYILAGPKYEKKVDKFSINYEENITSINVQIKELDTKIGIENSQIKLLNSDKELISTLTTNEQGKVFIEHLLPGKYYIEQITSQDGYNIYKKQIELNLDYNKVINLTINNAPINIQNFYNKEENIIIEEEIVEKNYNNEIVDKNINNKTDITNENNTNEHYTENNNVIEKNQNNKNTNTNVSNNTETTNTKNTNNNIQDKDYKNINLQETENIKTLPKTGM